MADQQFKIEIITSADLTGAQAADASNYTNSVTDVSGTGASVTVVRSIIVPH